MSHSTAKPKCPGCQQKVVPNSETQSVVCASCSKAKRRVFRFCWDCQREWSRNTSPNSVCTQPNCGLRAALLTDRRIADPNSSAKGCPYFRACPNCNALLTHNGQGCPDIECPECETEFCFRCLDDYIITDSHEIEQCTIVDNSQSLLALR